MSDAEHCERLLALRDELLQEMAAADLEHSRVRMQIERLESDLRIGRPEAGDYTQLKGKALPQAESRVLDLFRDLLKLEDRINAAKGR